ncbi:MAG: asparaginase [Deinococcus sp.]|nr:asparaginase [Deinococcus sp.]
MRPDPSGAAVPALSGADLLRSAPSLAQHAQLVVDDFAHIPGWQMTPEQMFALAQRVQTHLGNPQVAGVVVTHGTDTIEETAYLLDLTLTAEQPVAVVGAMRHSAEPSWDGPANLLAAVRTAAAPQARDQGVLVVLHNQIHAASGVRKTDSAALDTFKSPFGPLGIVDDDGVFFHRRSWRRCHIPAKTIVTPVDLIKVAAGSDDRLIRASVTSGAKGLVIEGFGRGHLPPKAVDGVRFAREQGLPVVLCSRCAAGRVLDTYGGVGGGRDLRAMGVIFGGDTSGPQARIQLMLALGAGGNVAEYF